MNSLNNLYTILNMRVVDFTGVAQNIGVKIRIIRMELSQFRGRRMTDDVGSNTENRLVIIIFIL